MSEFNDLQPVASQNTKEQEQSEIILNPENCFKVLVNGSTPPEATPKANVQKLINESEEQYSKYEIKMSPEWSKLVVDCGNHITTLLRNNGITVQNIEAFYPYFIPDDKAKLLDNTDNLHGFVGKFSRRPVIFVKASQPIELMDAYNIFHEMMHAVAKTVATINYNVENPQFRTVRGINTSVVLEEAIAHNTAVNFLWSQDSLELLRQRKKEELQKEFPNSTILDKEIIFSYFSQEDKLDLVTTRPQNVWFGLAKTWYYPLPNLAGTILNELLMPYSSQDQKKIQQLLMQARAKDTFDDLRIATEKLKTYWGNDIIESLFSTEYKSETFKQLLDAIYQRKGEKKRE